MENCIFCKIINRQIPAYLVYEDADIIAFLDIAQSTLGHTLVVPKKHYENILDIDAILLQKSILVAQLIAQKQMTTLPQIKGINILNNCHEVAGQLVMHFHLHVIPRYESSEMVIKATNSRKLTKDEFIHLQKQLEI